MAVVWIPAPMRGLTGGTRTIEVSAGTVGEVIDALEVQFPGMKARLCDDGQLRAGVAVAVDTQLATLGLRQTINQDSEVHFLPAISGG